MSNKIDAIKNKVVGGTQEKVGKISKDPALELKGKMKQGLGKAQEFADDTMHEAENLKDNIIGSARQKTGQWTDDRGMELKGRIQRNRAKNSFPKKLIFSIGILSILFFLVGWIMQDE